MPLQNSITTDSRRYGSTLSYGLEVVCMERVVFSYKNSWSRKAAVDVNTFLCSHLRNWCWKPFSGMLLLLLLLLFCCRWWKLLLGLLVLRPSISSLLKSAKSAITKCDGLLLQSWTSIIIKCDTFIIKCDRYNKVQRLLQSATEQSES